MSRRSRRRSRASPRGTSPVCAPRCIFRSRPSRRRRSRPTISIEEGWDADDDDDSGPTLLDTHGSVPPDIVAQARAVSDPLGETSETAEMGTNEIRTREVATREVSTRSFPRGEAPTAKIAMPPPALVTDADDPDEEFNHDDFPTRQTPMGFEAALLAMPLPTDGHRGLHETLPPPSDVEVAAPISPISPISADATAQMPNAPALPRLDELLSSPPSPADSSSISKVSHPSQLSRGPLVYPTPTSITGAPLPPANTVRFAFLRNLSPNNDPPIHRLVVVAAISFFATLALSAFVAWLVVLLRH